MEYYLAIKNEIMPFAATWVDLQIIILKEIRLLAEGGPGGEVPWAESRRVLAKLGEGTK